MPPEADERSNFQSVGWVRLSKTWEPLEANEAMFEIVEATDREELLHIPSVEFIAPEFREEALRHRSLRYEGKFSAYESVIVGLRGTRRRVFISAVPLMENGEFAGTILTVVDVTQVRRLEQEQRDTLNRYQAVVDALGDGVMVIDHSGAVLDANASAARILGIPVGELMRIPDASAGWHVRDEQGRELSADELPVSITMRTGQICRNFVLEVERPEGRWIWLEVNTEPILHDGEGPPRAVVASFHDISALKETHQQLRVREARLNRLLDAVPDLLFVMSADGVYLDYRASRPELLFFPPASFLGKNMSEVLPPEILELLQRALRATVKTGRIQTVEYSSDLHGARGFFEARTMPFDAETVLVVVRDVTEARLAEQRLRQHEQERLHLARLGALGEMSAGISHEIKQPLHAIANFAAASLNVLAANNEQAIEQVRQWLQKIASQAFRASEIVNRYRQFSSPAGHISNVPVSELLKEAIGLVEGELRRRGVQVETRNEAHDQPFVNDRIQVEQVLVNFLVNASEVLEANPTDNRRIVIYARLEGGKLRCEVADNGPGLPDVPPTQIFDAFFTTKASGMGLGLAISRTIIESHGGRIWARANTPRGAVFGFEIPPADHVG